MAVKQTNGVTRSEIQVFEARFGDKDGALALLECPQQMREFFLRLSDKADLPDSAPAGAIWAPFIRGWRQDDYYIFTLTQPDTVAVRPGMISTRMFAAALSEAAELKNLKAVLDVLCEPNRKYAAHITIPSPHLDSSHATHHALVACVANRLIVEEKPAVVIGQEEFNDIVSALWMKLPPDLRTLFSFGFSFTPADLSANGAKLVAVPKSCAARWSGASAIKCDLDGVHSVDDSLEVLLDDTKACEFRDFLIDVDLAFHSFSDYGRYVRLWSYWQKRGNNEIEVIFALLRSLGTLIPVPDVAIPQKTEAMHIAASLLKDATEKEILSLRSVKATAFPSNAAVLEYAVSEWFSSRFHRSQNENAASIGKILKALPSAQSPQWQDWIRKGIKLQLSLVDEDVARTIWSASTEKDVLKELAPLLPRDASTEKVLIRTFPEFLPDEVYLQLENLCIEREWLCLMGKTAFSRDGFDHALKLILSQGNVKSKSAAIEILCAEANPLAVWHGAFSHDDVTLDNCAVNAAKADPNLWNITACNLRRWAVLFELAAKSDPGFLRTFNATPVIARLYEALDIGTHICEAVCEALESADRLEFLQFKNRSRLWSSLPKKYQARARFNTLRAWLTDYYSQLPATPQLERELVEGLFASDHREFAFPCGSKNLGLGGLVLVETWGAEHECELWLNAVLMSRQKLPPDVAKRAAQLVASRRWARLAATARYSDEQNRRDDFRLIWKMYYDSLGRLEKLCFDLFARRPSPLIPTGSTSMIHALFVTALPEEFSAVCAHLSNRKESTEQGTVYDIGDFDCVTSQCTVAVVQTGMGNSQSAAATERALNLFKPRFAFFVGIAGGLRDDLKIGDVIAANKVYGYESGKSDKSFLPRPDAPPVSYEAEQRANAVLRDQSWRKRISPNPRTEPEAFVRPIAAGEKVLVSKSSTDLKRVSTTYTDAYAVAMEDHGFATAVRAHPNVCFAVIRGISDLIENKNEADRSGSHEIAARNAAAFAFEMLAGLVRGRERSSIVDRSFPD